ncbi:hypothetical protein B0G57_101394 [Trinickia symbiotica]|nr:hypothetical protein B0G57_101394 [Trinickia symbiotica]
MSSIASIVPPYGFARNTDRSPGAMPDLDRPPRLRKLHAGSCAAFRRLSPLARSCRAKLSMTGVTQSCRAFDRRHRRFRASLRCTVSAGPTRSTCVTKTQQSVPLVADTASLPVTLRFQMRCNMRWFRHCRGRSAPIDSIGRPSFRYERTTSLLSVSPASRKPAPSSAIDKESFTFREANREFSLGTSLLTVRTKRFDFPFDFPLTKRIRHEDTS